MYDSVVAWGAALSAISAGASVLTSIFIYKGQKQLQEKQHQDQKLLSQRQFIISLWEDMSNLNDIDPKAPVTAHVIKAVNVLELIAICCEGGMVDEQVIKRSFREGFIKLFTLIGACDVLPGKIITGKQLLLENPAAMKFGESLLREHQDRDALKK